MKLKDALLYRLGMVARSNYDKIADDLAHNVYEKVLYRAYLSNLRDTTPHQTVKEGVNDVLNNTAARATLYLSDPDSTD